MACLEPNINLLVNESLTLEKDFHGNIVVQGKDIVIDGNQYQVYGYILIRKSENVTVKNINIVINYLKDCYLYNGTISMVCCKDSKDLMLSDITLYPAFPLDVIFCQK